MAWFLYCNYKLTWLNYGLLQSKYQGSSQDINLKGLKIFMKGATSFQLIF